MGGKILRRIKKDLIKKKNHSDGVFFFLDYDGTLTELKNKPSLAKLDKDVRVILKTLAGLSRVKVFIISGRSLADVKKLVKIPTLNYIGNHGIELKGPRLNYINPPANSARPIIKKALSLLKKNVKYKGVIIEDKTYTLSVHYRLAATSKQSIIRKDILKNIKNFVFGGKIRVSEGKKVIEIRPNVKWDKGRIINWVLQKTKLASILTVCIGDDKTDEDAFRAVGKKGMTIVVSEKPRKSLAQYRLKSPLEVKKFLKWCINELAHKKS